MWMKIIKTDFTAASSVSVDNCFSAAYQHYLILRNLSGSSADQAIRFRLRASGADSTGFNYRQQNLLANDSTNTATRSLPSDSLSSWANVLGHTETASCGFLQLRVSYPFQSEVTSAFAYFSYDADGSLRLYQNLGSHDLTTAYDGFTAFPASGTITGSITVYGLRES